MQSQSLLDFRLRTVTRYRSFTLCRNGYRSYVFFLSFFPIPPPPTALRLGAGCVATSPSSLWSYWYGPEQVLIGQFVDVSFDLLFLHLVWLHICKTVSSSLMCWIMPYGRHEGKETATLLTTVGHSFLQQPQSVDNLTSFNVCVGG
jgi:hypothetical protein